MLCSSKSSCSTSGCSYSIVIVNLLRLRIENIAYGRFGGQHVSIGDVYSFSVQAIPDECVAQQSIPLQVHAIEGRP